MRCQFPQPIAVGVGPMRIDMWSLAVCGGSMSIHIELMSIDKASVPNEQLVLAGALAE
jgi:hypothetical protein